MGYITTSRAFRTRATTARSTARAPASSRARAQASAVAPVVNTSSIRRMRRPRMRRRPASVTTKAALTFKPPPAPALAALAGGVDRSDQSVGQIVAPSAAGQGPGDLGRLVEPARQQSEPMQRRRNDRVRRLDQFGRSPTDPAGEERRELLLISVFVAQDQAARGRVVQTCRPRPLKGVGLGDAGGAMGLGEGAAVVFERRSAAVAHRRFQKSDPAPGVRRQAGGGRRLAAVVRHRRQDQIGQTAPRASQLSFRPFPGASPVPILQPHDRPPCFFRRPPTHLRRRPSPGPPDAVGEPFRSGRLPARARRPERPPRAWRR